MTETTKLTQTLTPGSRMKTSKILTKYEKARVIGIRAMQLSQGAPAMINVFKEKDLGVLEIAEMELMSKKMPLVIRRKFPDGSYEDVDVNELALN